MKFLRIDEVTMSRNLNALLVFCLVIYFQNMTKLSVQPTKQFTSCLRLTVSKEFSLNSIPTRELNQTNDY